MSGDAVRIRLAQASDRAAAYAVCLATSDGGRGAAHLYDDPDALGHIYVGPYLALEQELAYVLEDSGGVCGYVLGALDSKRFQHRYTTEWLPGLRARYPEPSGNAAAWNDTQRAYHQYYHPDLFLPEPYTAYPSHLHIDLLPRRQGQGLGGRMMATLLERLKELNSPGVHLAMAIENQRAETFYRKLGFKTLATRADTLYLGLPLS